MSTLDRRYSREINRADDRFDVVNANADPWCDLLDEPFGKIVFKTRSIRALNYIEARAKLKLVGGGKLGGEDVHIAQIK